MWTSGTVRRGSPRRYRRASPDSGLGPAWPPAPLEHEGSQRARGHLDQEGPVKRLIRQGAGRRNVSVPDSPWPRCSDPAAPRRTHRPAQHPNIQPRRQIPSPAGTTNGPPYLAVARRTCHLSLQRALPSDREPVAVLRVPGDRRCLTELIVVASRRPRTRASRSYLHLCLSPCCLHTSTTSFLRKVVDQIRGGAPVNAT